MTTDTLQDVGKTRGFSTTGTVKWLTAVMVRILGD
jgi:hypothetical protein